MPSIVNFDNRQVIEPGAYSQVRGLTNTSASTATYGNVVLIDTGSGTGFGGGSGIIGELLSGAESIYEIAQPVDAKKFLRGGILYDLQDYLWSPRNTAGTPNRVYIVRAATTTCATATISFGTGNGAVTLKTRNEGVGSNGTLTGSVITLGYGWGLRAGIVNTSAFIMDFYEGQYRGLDPNGYPIDGITQAQAKNQIVCSSPEFTTANQLIAWMNTDYTFNLYFKLSASTASSSTLPGTLLTTFATLQTFAGATTVYSTTAMDAVLENLVELDSSMFLCDDYGIIVSPTSQQIQDGTNKGAQSAFNLKILAHVLNDAIYKNKTLYIGGGQDGSEFTRPGTSDGSIETAGFYNNPNVVLVHSQIKYPSSTATNGLTYKYLPSLYHAAMWCGMHAGMEPQIPGTFKSLRVIGVKHVLKKSERERALRAGVGHLRNVPRKGWVINQSVNTMQINDNQVYNDGTSPEISIMRIIHQLNKEIVINLMDFVGGNLATSSPEEVANFVNGYLVDRTARPQIEDNLILAPVDGFKVSVMVTNGDYYVRYCFVPNGPVNRVFATGFILDPQLSLTA